MQTECKTSQLNGASDSASETSEEPDHQDIAPNSPTDESRPKQCKTVLKVKVCASYKTKKTPLWRDAEDGTPYCNACGIRFKKYRICCPICSYIPRKDEKFGNSCCQQTELSLIYIIYSSPHPNYHLHSVAYYMFRFTTITQEYIIFITCTPLTYLCIMLQ